MIATTILIIAVLALSQSTVSSMRLANANREGALAQAALRQAVEDLQARNFEDIFALFNAYPGDDPGPGPAPGPGFAVPGLLPRDADADGLVGQYILPAVEVGGGKLELHETYPDSAMGMPRDLDGDTFIDDADQADEYQILPVRVRLEWKGKAGDRVLELRTLVTDR